MHISSDQVMIILISYGADTILRNLVLTEIEVGHINTRAVEKIYSFFIEF